MVLAGGASRRLGGVPKGLERIGNTRIIDRVATALSGVTTDLLVAANDPAAITWLPGIAVVPDQNPGTGGLAGVEAALEMDRDLLVVAWDMPFVTSTLLREIMNLANAARPDAVFPRSESPYGFEPFCAFYSRRLRAQLARFLNDGGGAAREFVGRLGDVRFIATAEVARIGDPRRLFFSVNTPDDLQRARAMAAETE